MSAKAMLFVDYRDYIIDIHSFKYFISNIYCHFKKNSFCANVLKCLMITVEKNKKECV